MNQDNTPNNLEHPDRTEPVVKSNKKLVIIAVILFIVFIAAISILITLLLRKNSVSDSSNTTTLNSSTTSQQTNESTNVASKKVIQTLSTSDPSVSLLIYEPKQTNSGTVFQYGLKNNCKGCNKTTYAQSPISFVNKNDTFLLDEDNGQKYSVLTDDDGVIIQSSSCNKYLSYNQVFDCFVSFAKVPSGSTVKFVTYNISIENIKIP